MIENVNLNPTGLNKDINASKYPTQFYFNANAIEPMTTNELDMGSLCNVKGNTKVIDLESLQVDINSHMAILRYSNDTETRSDVKMFNTGTEGLVDIVDTDFDIIGVIEAGNDTILFTKGRFLNSILLYKPTEKSVEIIYTRSRDSLKFGDNIMGIYNKETEVIGKVYWTDNENQVSYINILNDDSMNIAHQTISFCPEINFRSEPKLISTSSGGTHTAGKIQYAYNLLKENGSQSKISPLSDLIVLAKEDRGANINEVVSQINNMRIENIDDNFDIIRIYSIKYNTLEGQPLVSLIKEYSIKDLRSSKSIDFSDDNRIISRISTEEFLFLGGIPIVCKTIEAKDNRLFIGNFKSSDFDVNFDARAYGFSSVAPNVSMKIKDITNDNIISYTFRRGNNKQDFYDILKTIDDVHDAINFNQDTYNRDTSGLYGGEGPYLKYNFHSYSGTEDQRRNNKIFKQNETYRLGIEFYNKFGQVSQPKWIGDFKVPNDFNRQHMFLEIQLTEEGRDLLINQGVTGWRVLRALRRQSDKTVLCQCVAQPTMYQKIRDVSSGSFEIDQENYDIEETKFPSLLLKQLNQSTTTDVNTLGDTVAEIKLREIADYTSIYSQNPSNFVNEFYYSKNHHRRRAVWMNTRLMQLNSPEITFDSEFNIPPGANFLPSYTRDIEEEASIGKVFNFNQDRIIKTIRNNNGLWMRSAEPDVFGHRNIQEYSIFSPNERSDNNQLLFFYRGLSNSARFPNEIHSTPIIGSPIRINPTSEVVRYEGSSDYAFRNNFLLTEIDNKYAEDSSRVTVSMDTYGSDSILIQAGDSQDVPLALENLCENVGLRYGVPIIDITINNEGQYGGKSFEDRRRTEYLQIGSLMPINLRTHDILSYGDTYIHLFRYLRTGRGITDDVLTNPNTLRFSETVDVILETSYDLRNRSDFSGEDWDSRFQPRIDEYHEYNSVYSKEDVLTTRISTPFTFVPVKEFPASIRASKVKFSNELVDNWTDLLVNETQDLEAKYGDINRLYKFSDNVFCLQEDAVSYLSINPRVAISGNDGSQVELGTGTLFSNYRYLTTNSGLQSSEAINNTGAAIYYIDEKNKVINMIHGGNVEGITVTKGVNSFCINNMDNASGSIVTVDNIEDKVRFIVKSDTPFNMVYNEALGNFTHFLPFIPSKYWNSGNLLLSLKDSDTSGSLWQHNIGSNGSFYDVNKEQSVSFIVAPNCLDSIFTNINMILDIDGSNIGGMSDITMHLTAENEYQESLKTQLVYGKNIVRKYRNWYITIPRDSQNKIKRMRGRWIKLTLFFNTNGRKVCLKDINVAYNKII